MKTNGEEMEWRYTANYDVATENRGVEWCGEVKRGHGGERRAFPRLKGTTTKKSKLTKKF